MFSAMINDRASQHSWDENNSDQSRGLSLTIPSFYYEVRSVCALPPIISDYAVMPRRCQLHAVLNLATMKEGKDVPRVAAPSR